MNSTREEDSGGLEGVGKWVAIASELPCSVISLLFVGQIVGASLWGAEGETWGVLIGAFAGFFLGVWGVYVTVQYYEKQEHSSLKRRPYTPSREEILEEPDFLQEEESAEE
ncbi:hypothetical protein EU538_01660 [Candidatus Thorarchaeota archaeon]|nr:MAG: hypothetical protein EU538_01660 [Candidatus Thorarchaeota archaeon]